MSSIDLPAGSSWVVASLFSIVPVLHYQLAGVARARKRAGVRYPQLYAEKVEQEASKDAMIFNCAQRAHQNTLENVPIVVLSTLISAIHYPIYAAVGCGIWSLSRILYTAGYSSGDPSRRRHGSLGSLGVQGLLSVLAGKVVFDLIRAGV
jgi:glutathione S-transferase